MEPYANQILGFASGDPQKRIGGLVLEVKGDFCHRVREILARHGRADDYIEINLTSSPYRYNPLFNELDPYALAFGVATLLTSLFGRGREPFWQQAYTNMTKFIILLHRLLYDYVTLMNVYECAIDPDLLKQRIELLETALRTHKVAVVDLTVYLAVDGLGQIPMGQEVTATNQMESPLTDALAEVLLENQVLHQVRDCDDVLPSGVRGHSRSRPAGTSRSGPPLVYPRLDAH